MRREDVRIKLYRGAWYAIWREGNGTKRAALHTKDRGAAERNLIDFVKLNSAELETVSDIMLAFQEDRRGKPSESRIIDAWKRLKPHFGHLRPPDVTRQCCREYTAMRRRRVKPGTIIKELSILRTALRWQDKNTPAIVELPPQPPPRDRSLTRAEYRLLRESAAPNPHCQLFIHVAYSTAGRAGAVLELTWDRVDFKRRIIQLATEDEHGNKGRATVPITDSLYAALVKAQEGATTEYVVEFGGRRVHSIRKAFKAACGRAGLEDVTPHVLRHTAAVHLAESGVPMSEIAQYLGHRDSSTTERIYARYSPDYLRRAAANLE